MRRGFTLLELLIVVVVMSILMAVTLPAVKYGIEGHRTKSVAEILVNQIRVAQSLAAERNSVASLVLSTEGRPVVHAVGVAPPGAAYSGDVVGSLALLSLSGPMGLRAEIDDGMAGSLIRPGDAIRFNHHWHWYTVAAVSVAQVPSAWRTPIGMVPTWIIDLLPSPQSPVTPPIPAFANWVQFDGTIGVPGTYRYRFTVRRQPDSRGAFESLLHGACIDLSASGYGPSDSTFGTGATVTAETAIDFRPDGSVSAVRFAGSPIVQQPTDPIYLCIGSLDAAGLDVGGVPENATNPRSLWVRIMPRTGRAVVLPIAWTPTRSTLADSRSIEE